MGKADRTELPELEAKVARLREKEARARSKAEQLERKIRKLKGEDDSSDTADRDSEGFATASASPTGVRAIRLLLAEEAERVWTAGEIHHELESRGWVSASATHRLRAVEAVLSRLVRRGEIVRLRPGRYRVPEGGSGRDARIPPNGGQEGEKSRRGGSLESVISPAPHAHGRSRP